MVAHGPYVPNPRSGEGLAADRDGGDALLGKRSLGGGEAREGDAVGRAAHVVEAQLVAESDGARVSAVLAADANLDVRLDRARALHPDLHELSHPTLIEGLERIRGKDLL